jgi:spoIIIJ-associated protein
LRIIRGGQMSNKDDVAESAKGILEDLLKRLEVEGTVVISTEDVIPDEPGEANPVALEIKGEDLGILIGWRGQTLASLQYVLRLINTNKTESYVPIIIDVEGYRKRRDASLRALALRIAEQVKAKRAPFKMEPMPAYERRIVHLALANNPDVVTSSTGEGELRRVVISLK